MYISELRTHNFRRLKSCSMKLFPGLNVLLGENNVGKSTAIDALRMIFSIGQGPRDIWATTEDLYHDGRNNPEGYFEIHVTFSGVTGNEQGLMSKCLVSQDRAELHYRFERTVDAQGQERKVHTIWGGHNRNMPLDTSIMEHLSTIFLPALRDAERELRPGRSSRISHLLSLIASEAEQQQLVNEVDQANRRVQASQAITQSTQAINEYLQGVSPISACQTAELVIADASFKRIADSLRVKVGQGTNAPIEITENGLGYNNLLYVATVLSELKQAQKTAYKLLLIEEPEAHLHPQLQYSMIEYLARESTSVQVIVTSHSPTLACHVPFDEPDQQKNLLLMNPTVSTGATVAGLRDLGLSADELSDLRRYLDATKANLFFAAGVILVEGISEALLLPVLAKRLNLDLTAHRVAIVNVGSLAFDPFAKLYASGQLGIPCALVTDSDPTVPETHTLSADQVDQVLYPSGLDQTYSSDTSRKLKAMERGDLKVFLAAKTLEYDLALAGNTDLMAEVYQSLHPIVGARMFQAFKTASDGRTRARAFMTSAENGKNLVNFSDKANFAQRLAGRLEKTKDTFIIPQYLERTIRYACGV